MRKHRKQTKGNRKTRDIRTLGNGYGKRKERGHKIVYACINGKKNP